MSESTNTPYYRQIWNLQDSIGRSSEELMNQYREETGTEPKYGWLFKPYIQWLENYEDC